MTGVCSNSEIGECIALRVLILEDGAIARTQIRKLFESALIEKVLVRTSANISQARAEMAEGLFDLVVSDVELDKDSKGQDGFDFVESIRSDGFHGIACMHSHINEAEGRKRAKEVGADLFVPKMMQPAQMEKLLMLAKQNKKRDQLEISAPSFNQTNLEFSVVDDGTLNRRAWSFKIKDAVVNSFANPSEFWSHVKTKPEFLNRQKIVIVDLNFDNEKNVSGFQLAEELRPRFANVILLSSCDNVQDISRHPCIDGVIPKIVSKDVLEDFIRRGVRAQQCPAPKKV